MHFRLALCAVGAVILFQGQPTTRRITWRDVEPLQARLAARGITAATFPSYVDRVGRDNSRRVREGDLDHLVFYALQSTHFTTRPPIEPALSAKAFVEGGNRLPSDVTARIKDLLAALDSSSSDPRLVFFRALVRTSFPSSADREAALVGEYRRAMRFVYDKEFVARRKGPDAVAELYRTRGLSTDTAVEAGFVVYSGLGILKALDAAREIKRVLIVGPGLDLAPRTSLLEDGPPESYQPWAVIDALLSLGLSAPETLAVIGADINPRVVDHLRRAGQLPPMLTLVSGIAESPSVHLASDYRQYFSSLGRAIGETFDKPLPGDLSWHLFKTVRVRSEIARALSGEQLDIVTSRLTTAPFDLIIATNILPYFDDAELMLATSNIAAMLAPGGVFMHNETRPFLGEATEAVGLSFEQLRRVTIASVTGAAAPLTDVVILHRKSRSQ